MISLRRFRVSRLIEVIVEPLSDFLRVPLNDDRHALFVDFESGLSFGEVVAIGRSMGSFTVSS